MRWQLAGDWPVGPVLIPTGTVLSGVAGPDGELVEAPKWNNGSIALPMPMPINAMALDQEAALATGIDIRTVYALAWGIAAVIATIGGVLLPLYNGAGSFDITLGTVALAAFPAIILGGADSFVGAVVGGILIGLTSQLFNRYDNFFAPTLGPGVYAVAPYLLMILILLIRPYGLFGARKVERI